MKRVLTLWCAAALVAVSGLASDMGKYKDWPNTPEGYFMTKADRAEWSKLRSEADADAFIKKFLDSRGPDFAQNVAAAAKAADDHLSVGTSRGSRTLRGKVVILLGPPSNFTITQRRGSIQRNLTTSSAAHVASAGQGTPILSASDIADANIQNEMSAKYVHDYALTYAKDKLPTHPAKDFPIVIEVNPATGEDRIVDTRMSRMVDELLEAAAEARATAPAK